MFSCTADPVKDSGEEERCLKKKLLSILIALALILALAVPAFAADEGCVVLGADLSEEQIETVYQLFGFKRGSVTELTVTNAEERSTLEGLVEDSVIGTYAISCVYVRLLEKGSGLSVETHNINWCTTEMYQNALVTAGITDAKIIVAAPFEVSGTAALTGIYKAYEHLTGRTLDEDAKSAGTRELTITGKLAEQIGGFDASGIISGLKEKIGETAKMSDEELREEIVRVAGSFGVTLNDSQIRQLIDLFRSMEKLNPDELNERIDQAKETIERIGEAKDKAVGIYERLKSLLAPLSDFFEGLKELFG